MCLVLRLLNEFDSSELIQMLPNILFISIITLFYLNELIIMQSIGTNKEFRELKNLKCVRIRKKSSIQTRRDWIIRVNQEYK